MKEISDVRVEMIVKLLQINVNEIQSIKKNIWIKMILHKTRNFSISQKPSSTSEKQSDFLGLTYFEIFPHFHTAHNFLYQMTNFWAKKKYRKYFWKLECFTNILTNYRNFRDLATFSFSYIMLYLLYFTKFNCIEL